MQCSSSNRSLNYMRNEYSGNCAPSEYADRSHDCRLRLFDRHGSCSVILCLDNATLRVAILGGTRRRRAPPQPPKMMASCTLRLRSILRPVCRKLNANCDTLCRAGRNLAPRRPAHFIRKRPPEAATHINSLPDFVIFLDSPVKAAC